MTQVQELDDLALELIDDIGPQLISAIQVSPSIIHLYFSDNLDIESAEEINNYSVDGLPNGVDVQSAYVLYGRRVALVLSGVGTGDFVSASGILDNNGNALDPEYNSADVGSLLVVPHLVGDFNSWDPSDHEYDFTLNDNGLWQLVLDLPPGEYGYKVLESDEWNENDWPGVNQQITLEAQAEVTLIANCGFYTGVRNWDEFVSHTAPVIIGNFLDEMDMGADWDTLNTAGLMSDDDGDGIFAWEALIPFGDWEYKVILNQNWDQDTYGNGGNFSVSSDGIVPTIFRYDFRQNSSYYVPSTDCLLLGDANIDGNIDVLDIVIMVGYVLGNTEDVSCSDLNGDGSVNVLDIVSAVASILN